MRDHQSHDGMGWVHSRDIIDGVVEKKKKKKKEEEEVIMKAI